VAAHIVAALGLTVGDSAEHSTCSWQQIMHIRTATNLDRSDINSVYLSAFDEGERDLVSKLAINLLSEETTPQTISLVAEAQGIVVGHVAFSPVTIDNKKNFLGYILAPLGVKPDYQKLGIGSELIEIGKARLSIMGVDVIFVYGDPNYYGKFGFNAHTAAGYSPPYELQYAFGWQAIILKENIVAGSTVRISCVDSLTNPALW
jgi:putative acetyltransferase